MRFIAPVNKTRDEIIFQNKRSYLTQHYSIKFSPGVMRLFLLYEENTFPAADILFAFSIARTISMDEVSATRELSL